MSFLGSHKIEISDRFFKAGRKSGPRGQGSNKIPRKPRTQSLSNSTINTVKFNHKILQRLNILRLIGLQQGRVHYFWLQLEFCIPPLFDGVFYKKFFLPGIMINFSEFDHRTKNSTTAIMNYQFVKIALFIKNVKLEP